MARRVTGQLCRGSHEKRKTEWGRKAKKKKRRRLEGERAKRPHSLREGKIYHREARLYSIS